MIMIPFERFSKLYPDIRFIQVDTEKVPLAVKAYNVQCTPTFVLFKEGTPYKVIPGAFYKELMTAVDDLHSFLPQ